MASDAVIEPVRRSFAVLEALSRRRTSTLAVLIERDRAAAADRGAPAPDADRARLCRARFAPAGLSPHRPGARPLRSIRFVDHLVDAAIPHMSRFTVRARLAALSRHLEPRRHHHPPFDGAGKPDVVRGRGAQPPPAAADQRARPRWLAFCPEEERRTILRDIGGLAPRRKRRSHGARARPPRRLRLYGPAAAHPHPGHGRADPQRRSRAGQPLAALSAVGDDRRGGRPALRPPPCALARAIANDVRGRRAFSRAEPQSKTPRRAGHR